MRLLGLFVILWLHDCGNALKCVNGIVARNGEIVSRNEQDILVREYVELTVCHFAVYAANCSNASFIVEGRKPAAALAKDRHCFLTNNSILFCGCADDDFCNIRLYGLLSILHSETIGMEPEFGCYEQLLHEIMPAFEPGPDTTAKFIKQFSTF